MSSMYILQTLIKKFVNFSLIFNYLIPVRNLQKIHQYPNLSNIAYEYWNVINFQLQNYFYAFMVLKTFVKIGTLKVNKKNWNRYYVFFIFAVWNSYEELWITLSVFLISFNFKLKHIIVKHFKCQKSNIIQYNNILNKSIKSL